MAGLYTRTTWDVCANDYDTYTSQAASDYHMFLGAYWRPDQQAVTALSVGTQPSTYGPLRGALVTQESFLTRHLGQTLSDCPESDVVYLPETLFPAQPAKSTSCYATDLEPLQTRMKGSCNGIRETDMSAFWMFPSAYQVGYTGPDVPLQSRMPPPSDDLRAGAESYGTCRQNYGNYGSGRSFAPYSV